MEPSDKVTFHLRYEELLQRSEKGQYNYALNLQPENQIVNDFKISIKVNESLPLKDISVKCIRDEEKPKFEAETITQEVLEFDQKSAPHEATIEFDPRLLKSAQLTTDHLTQVTRRDSIPLQIATIMSMMKYEIEKYEVHKIKEKKNLLSPLRVIRQSAW